MFVFCTDKANIWNVRKPAPPAPETYRSAPSALQRVHLWRNAHQPGAAGVVLPPAVLVWICRRTQVTFKHFSTLMSRSRTADSEVHQKASRSYQSVWPTWDPTNQMLCRTSSCLTSSTKRGRIHKLLSHPIIHSSCIHDVFSSLLETLDSAVFLTWAWSSPGLFLDCETRGDGPGHAHIRIWLNSTENQNFYFLQKNILEGNVFIYFLLN